jgi:hypothetical protein
MVSESRHQSPQRPRHHFGAVVHPQVFRGAPIGHQGDQDVDELIGVAGTAHSDGECLSGELVDDVGHLEAALVSCLVEAEINGSHLVRPACPESLGEGGTQPAALAAGRRPL